jgi:hypothetical protein
MCGAIVSDRHNPKTIATGCADPSYNVPLLQMHHPVGGASRGDYAQDVRYIAIEHTDVRRDCSRLAQPQSNRDRLRRSLLQLHPWPKL